MQALGLLVAGLAIDAALRRLAIMDAACLFGEARPDIVAIGLDLLAQLLEHRLGVERHAGGRRRYRRRRLARLADPRRHHRLADLAVAAQGTAQLLLRQLRLIGGAAREPALELVVL